MVILVNKDNLLDKDYIPDNLVLYNEYNGIKIDSNYVTLVDEETLFYFNELNKGAIKNGYYFIVDSAYRSYEYQSKILQKELEEKGDIAYKFVALPASSEHQTGLAIDVAIKKNGIYTDKFDDSFEEIKWLHENMYRYGFILRYPKGYENITGFNYECWHIRYVGKDISIYMHDNNINTLEEYCNNLKKDKIKSI